MITLAENFKKLRHQKGLTQENIASFLGVSFQAVSKWERGEGYPDITMLPVIANYFEVTIDDLLGNDLYSKEERIDEYCRLFWNQDDHLNMDECVAIAKEAYTQFPYDWRIIEIYILALTRRFTVIPAQNEISQLRTLCDLVMKKCPLADVRKRAIYTMIFVEDDENVDRWFQEAPDNIDYLACERKEERYCDRRQWDKYYPQKQQNMMDLINALIEKMGYYEKVSTPELRVMARKRRVEFLKVMFTENDRLLLSGKYGGCLIELAMALDEVGQYSEAVNALEKAFECYELQLKFAENNTIKSKVCLQDPMWNKLQYPVTPGKFYARVYEAFAQKEVYATNPAFCDLIAKVRSIN